MKSGFWFCVRVVIVILWATGGIADRWPAPQLSVAMSVLACLVCFFWASLATRFLVILPYRKLPKGQVWLRPSWWVSPFHAEQPYQFFHLAGFSFLVFGVAAGIHTLMVPPLPQALPAEIYVGLFGLGILCGMAWAACVFRRRFVVATRTAATRVGRAQDSGISSVSSSG